MPQFGFGTWRVADGEEAKNSVQSALSTGYRLIDTAALYGNEVGVGQALLSSGVPRNEVFVTTKLWNDSHQYDKALQAFDDSLERLGLDYIDLYLIHWPVPSQDLYIEAWRALERLYEEKRVRAIGISNFQPTHVEKLLASVNTPPAVNQIELHPRLQQLETRRTCQQHDIHIESWSPLMRGGELLNEPSLVAIAQKYNKTVAQVVLRWHIDSGLIVIPKSVHVDRIRENYDIWDFSLDQDDMERIAQLDSDRRTGPDPTSM
ncbi:aldo/keto reductase [Candidatus Saccharibacteria bacterium]|nr:aldo/keto reductase [Candidatus Saccharibacteria bacterium]